MVKLEYPFEESKTTALKLGQVVSLSGLVYTGRDRLHKYLHEGGRSPVNLKNSAIYHCGPIVLKEDGGWHVRAAGPTTSVREEPYMAGIIAKHKVKVIIGKGGMGNATAKACAEYGCVYLQVTGGAAATLARNIEFVSGVHFLQEFGQAEAMWEFIVKDMTAIVAIDSKGRSLYKRVTNSSKRVLKDLLAAKS